MWISLRKEEWFKSKGKLDLKKKKKNSRFRNKKNSSPKSKYKNVLSLATSFGLGLNADLFQIDLVLSIIYL